MNKGHYLDCIELLERNSRKSSYVKNQAEDLRRLVDEYKALKSKCLGRQTKIDHLSETIEKIRGYREKIDRRRRR